MTRPLPASGHTCSPNGHLGGQHLGETGSVGRIPTRGLHGPGVLIEGRLTIGHGSLQCPPDAGQAASHRLPGQQLPSNPHGDDGDRGPHEEPRVRRMTAVEAYTSVSFATSTSPASASFWRNASTSRSQ